MYLRDSSPLEPRYLVSNGDDRAIFSEKWTSKSEFQWFAKIITKNVQ